MIFAPRLSGKGAISRRLLSITLIAALLLSLLPVSTASSAASAAIPGKIEVENWSAMSGVQTESTADTGGGLDVGWIDAGDWMDYTVDVASAGKYTVDFRVASKNGGGTVQLQDSSSTVLTSVYVPSTGAWQWWTTVSATANLSAGPQTLRVYAAAGGFNFNWINISAMPSATITSLQAVNVTTTAGSAPVLPTVVTAVYSDGSTSQQPVSWNAVAASQYATAGSFTVNGTVPGTTIQAVANVTVVTAAAAVPGKIEAENWTAMNGVRTESTADTGGGLDVGWTDAGDWMDYNVNVASAGIYNVDFRVASQSGGGQIQLRDSSGAVLATSSIPSTGAWQWWTTVSATANLSAGPQTLRVYAINGGFNINWINFTAVPAATITSLQAVNVSTTAGAAPVLPTDVTAVYSDGLTKQLPVTWNGVAASQYAAAGSFTVNGTVQGTAIQAVANVTVVAAAAAIPGKIESENWSSMSGVQTESTADTGGGLNVGWIDTGDWMDYKVNVASAGIYNVDFRVASKSAGGQIQLRDSSGAVLTKVDIPNTGFFQWWTTVSATMHLNAGTQTLRVYAAAGGFNLNWMNFSVKSFTPTGLYAFAGNTKATIGWTAVTEAISYNVKRSTVSGGPYQQIANVAPSSYNDSNLLNDTAYYYVISAVTAYGESTDSAQIAVTPAVAASTLLKGTARDSQVTLQWDAVQGADTYDLQRSDNGGASYTMIAPGLTTTTYTDAGLADGTNYQYVVQSKSAGGATGNSSALPIAPVSPLASPTGLAAAAGNSKVDLTWNSVAGATSYTVKRSTLSGRSYSVIADNLTDPAFTDTTVANGSTYFYVVSASNAQTESMNSDQVIVTPFNIVPGAPSIPDNVTAQAGSNRVTLQWNTVSGASSYHVNRAASFTGPYTTIANVTGTGYSDVGLTNGNTYFYSVSAVNAIGEGAGSAALSATPANVIVVSKDGTGDFTTVNAAVDSIPGGNPTRQVIYIRNGVYREKITIPSNKPYISFIGESRDGTIITYDDYANAIGTSKSFTVMVSASDFSAENLTILNAAYPRTSVGPAVALYVNADRAIFTNVRLAGYQDTLYTNSGRQYYKDSIIEGDVDWIFGNANAIFDHSEIKMVGNGGGYVTAASTDQFSSYGYTFLNSKLTRGTSFLKNYVAWDPAWDIDKNISATNSTTDLGRPWRAYANVKFINTWMDAHINATGWFNWGNPANELTARYGEYNSSGPGANPKARYKWTGQLTSSEANSYTVQNIFQGTDGWDPTLFGILPRNGQPPASPSGLSASYANGSNASLGDSPVKLTWNTIVSAKTYNVYRSSNAGGPFTQIANNLTPSPATLLATIEAENYAAMSGVKTESTTDSGGGLDVGSIDAGDWIDYSLSVPADGTYTVALRVAAPNSAKQFQLKASDGTVLATVNVPQTGGWQSWTTVSVPVNLKAGTQTVRVYSVTGGVNLNWIKLVDGVDGKMSYLDTVMNTGAPYYYAVTAFNDNGESAYSNAASISNAVTTFDRNILNQADITVSVQISGDIATGITNDTYSLVQNTDYSVNGNIFTIKKSFLTRLPIGTNTLTYTFSSGKSIPLLVNVVNTTPLPGQTISNVPALKLYTIAGVAPYMPAIVPVNFTDQSEKALPVTWDHVSPTQYASVGSFTAQGVITGTNVTVTANVTVEPVNSVGAVTGGTDLQSHLTNLPFDMPAFTLYTFPDHDFNIKDYGAVGDGATKNTEAFTKAIAAAAANPGGSRVVVPAGVWYTGPIVMQSNVNLHLEDGAKILFSSDYSDYQQSKGVKSLISGSGLSNIAITGNGVIDGNGLFWRPVKKSKVTTTQWNYLLSLGGVLSDDGSIWYPSGQAVDVARPLMVDISSSSNVLLDGPILMNSPTFAVSFTRDQYLVIRNTTVNNDAWYQNADGLDVTSSQYVVMYHNTVNAGDDAIGMKSSSDPGPVNTQASVVVEDNIVFRGHGGVSFGSNTSGGIKNLAIRNNQFIGTDAGINIKSYVGGGGPIENIYIDGIHMQNIGGAAISISDFYRGHDAVLDNAKLGVDYRVPEIKNIHISNVAVDGADQAVSIDALVNVPLHDMDLTNVKITATNGWVSSNTANVTLNNVQIIPSGGAVYTFTNASNILFNNVLSPPGTSTFIHLSGTASNIQLKNTDYSNAGVPFLLDQGISPGVITIIKLPSAPVNLSEITGNSEVYLTWDSVQGVDYYNVKRSTTGGTDYQTIASNVTSNTYLDAGLDANSTYSYIVTAVNDVGESVPSNGVVAKFANPSDGLPIATITGIPNIFAGQSFNMTYGLSSISSNVTSSAVFTQDITFQYNPNLLEFNSAESLFNDVIVSSVSNDPAGKVRILLSRSGDSSGVNTSGDLLKLIWKVKAFDQPGNVITPIYLSEAVMKNAEGTESVLANTFAAVQIKIDKSALDSKIMELGSLNAGSYSSASWAILQSYLNAAISIQNNAISTQDQVNAAANNLQIAKQLLLAPSTKTSLSSKISDVNAFISSALVGDQWGQYAQSVVDALSAAISQATTVLGDSDAEQAAVDQAAVALEIAIQHFLISANPAKISDLAAVSTHYGLNSASTGWTQVQKYDINQDGKLDIADLASISRNIRNP
jgi:polygalacturonase/pectin methylesterase-like acyl-CoA thioesterase/fibronectin type 3 domain-containing protein